MARQALAQITQRILTKESGDEGLLALIDVVDDIGRGLARDQASQLRGVIPFIAAGREALEDHYHWDGVRPTPMQALIDVKDGAAYAAGALWVLSAVTHAWLSEKERAQRTTAEQSGRHRTREAVLALLRTRRSIRPQDVIEELRGHGEVIDRATVSRALSDLIESGHVEPSDTSPGGDRRHRWYQLT